jgi:predicted flap endonuclease-1-like 5' DNA nuclease
VADDEATNKYQPLENNEEVEEKTEDGVEENDSENSEKDIIDTTASDDLTKIEGIGPKIAEALMGASIYTFADLALKTPEEISEIISDVAGSHNPET